MSMKIGKSMSLVERKKQQWAKEREELAGLYAPWSFSSRESENFDKSFGRNSNNNNNNKYHVTTFPNVNNNEYINRNNNNKESFIRRSSLPPLYKNQYNSFDREKEMGGETSGYGSDNPNQWNQSGYESSSSYRDDRPKWREKNMGKFWDSIVKDECCEKFANEPPNWVKRGLQRDEEIVVSNTSPAESPEGDPIIRPCTNCSSTHSNSNHNNRTHIRGQNIPVDSVELAEREKKRQIALAHQEAIRQQLEERENRKKMEKERRIQEELEEELRIEREQEIERQRKERELKLLKEKQEKEQKRKEALQEALEIAEKEAKLEKMKSKLIKQNNNNNNNNVNINTNRNNSNCDKTDVDDNIKNNSNNNFSLNNVTENEDNQKSNYLLEQNNNKNVLINSPRQEVLNNEINNLQPSTKTVNTKVNEGNSSHNNKENSPREEFISNHNDNTTVCTTTLQALTTPRTENLAILLQAPLENFQTTQYAILMPNLGAATQTASFPIAIPIALTSQNNNSNNNTPRTENRLLTPTLYRNRNNKKFCDSTTQTESSDFRVQSSNEMANNQKLLKEKLTNLESNYESGRNRKGRSRLNEDRNREINVEERPKWGANRPPTRYLKQSEKDPLYQRRKLRQKMRDYKNSSDDSPPGSPTSFRKNYIDKRQTRALWRKGDHFFTRNIRMYQTEIVPLESDKEHIYYKQCCCRCNCDRHNNNYNKVEVLKTDEQSAREYKDEGIIGNEIVESNSDIIETASKYEWDISPRTPSLTSSTRNMENN